MWRSRDLEKNVKLFQNRNFIIQQNRELENKTYTNFKTGYKNVAKEWLTALEVFYLLSPPDNYPWGGLIWSIYNRGFCKERTPVGEI